MSKIVDEGIGNTVARTVGVLSDAAKRKKQVATPGKLDAAAAKLHQAQRQANEDITGTDNQKPQETDPFKKPTRALGVMSKQKKKRVAQEDISAEPLNRTANVDNFDPLLGKKKRKHKLRDVLNVDKPVVEQDVSENIGGPPAFIIQVQQVTPLSALSQWRSAEVLPQDYQLLAARLTQTKQALGPSYRVRAINQNGTLVDIM
jgi:hypothetical protein